MSAKKNKYGSIILPDEKYYSLDDYKTRLNNNVLVVGEKPKKKKNSGGN